ncbi:MAG: IS1634 family transposase [Opitutae bacterium]|nr:IS1634 family transposase [Opitutae bacterium]
MADLLGVDARAVQDDTLYRCHDLLLPLKEELFGHLRQRWSDLFGARYEVLLYDLTSTYLECDVPADETDPRRFGYSRDRRGSAGQQSVQVVVALVVTPEGLPLAYEMFLGNTADKKTLRGMLETTRRRYGAAERIWIMNRGLPTEEILAELRAADSCVRYLVGTPEGRLTRYEAAPAENPGTLCARNCASNCCRRTASSTSWPRAPRAPARSAACAAAGCALIGNASAHCNASGRPATRC